MKRNLLFLVLFIISVCARAQFTAGNLVVSKINTSFGQAVITNADATQNGYYGVLQQMTTAGTNVGSAIALPDLVFDARSVAYEGGLGLSKDGKILSIVGFTGGAGGNTAAFRAATVGRRIYRVLSNGTVDASFTNILPANWSGNGYRSVISEDGSRYLVATGSGTAEPGRTIIHGANNPTGTLDMSPWGVAASAGAIRNYTYTGAENGLYGCSSAGIFKFNETTGAASSLSTGDVAQVVLFDLQPAFGDANGNDVMYAANRNSGVTKFTWSGTAWVAGTSLNGSAVDGNGATTTDTEPGFGVYALTGKIVGGKPNLYCISHNGNGTSATYKSSHIVKIVDNTTYDVDWSYPGTVITIIASTGDTEMFRSVAFAPQGTLSTTSFEKKAQGWSMFPNPSKGLLNIDAKTSENFSIYNMLGQKVHQFKVQNGSNAVNVDRLTNGAYFVKGANTTQKLIIQK